MITDDPFHPGINQPGPDGQDEAYLVLSEEERRKGFVRPYRDCYTHDTCGRPTTMGRALSETYARKPDFYTHTFCAHCRDHFPVAEFRWLGTDIVLGS